jgi:hypothetical protein
MADMIREPAIRCQICFNNATVVDDAIRFVSQKSREKVESTDSNNEDDKEPNEPDYDEDKDQLEEKTGRGNWSSNNKSSFLMITVVKTLKASARVYQRCII